MPHRTASANIGLQQWGLTSFYDKVKEELCIERYSKNERAIESRQS